MKELFHIIQNALSFTHLSKLHVIFFQLIFQTVLPAPQENSDLVLQYIKQEVTDSVPFFSNGSCHLVDCKLNMRQQC